MPALRGFRRTTKLSVLWRLGTGGGAPLGGIGGLCSNPIEAVDEDGEGGC